MVSSVSSLPHVYVYTHSSPQLLFQLCIRGCITHVREQQRMNSEMFLELERSASYKVVLSV